MRQSNNEQAITADVPESNVPARSRSNLPVVRTAMGSALPNRTNAELNRILDEEDADIVCHSTTDLPDGRTLGERIVE